LYREIASPQDNGQHGCAKVIVEINPLDKRKEPAPEESQLAISAPRRKPLPWQRPKPVEDDPEALVRVEAILKSRSYRRADDDLEFLALKNGLPVTEDILFSRP
jgi:hypothetical protein